MELPEIVDQVVDIVSSGDGGELEDWHFKELKKLFRKVPSSQRDELLELIVAKANDTEGWFLGDLQEIAELLKSEKSVKFCIV